jgi:thiamine pyrophosphokinase
VVADGDVVAADRELVVGAETVVAADGGALALERWGIVPHLVVGDLDSLGRQRAEALGKRGAKVIPYPAAKDQSDLELALRYAVESGADEIVVLGAFGGKRLDHSLANATLLADPAYRGLGVRAVQGTTQVRAVHGNDSALLAGPIGAIVTLLPLRGDAKGVRTVGLEFPLAGDTLQFGRSRGLSNVVTALPASVSLEHGVLLVIEETTGEKT